tara:strand:- start:165 stop:860 length:696 start_codon:yes stop_codon:yes gene_type:complete
MDFNFSNKTALITGGTRGIGKQISNDLESLGAEVISIGSNDFDLTDPTGLNQLTKFIKSYSQIDILVNNAGINFNQYIDAIEEEKFDNLMHINLKAPFLITKEVSKLMKKNKYGRIVNIASIAGNRVRGGRTAYSTSKAGLIAFTKTIAAELAPHNILCNTVSPGFTLTEMTTTMLSKEEIEKHVAQIPIGRLGDVKDISSAVLYLASDMNNFITGHDLIVDGGFINTISI